MTGAPRKLVAAGSIVVIIASAFSIYITQFTPQDPQDRALLGVGQVMAEETARLLDGHGRIVVMTCAPELSAVVQVETAAFLKRLHAQPAIAIIATEFVPPHDIAKKGAQMGLSPQRLLSVAAAHRDADAIVSFVGVPRFNDKELSQWAVKPPKFLAVTRTRNELPGLLTNRVLQAAIVPRFQFPSPVKDTPRTVREFFDEFYQMVSTAAQLPPPDLTGASNP